MNDRNDDEDVKRKNNKKMRKIEKKFEKNLERLRKLHLPRVGFGKCAFVEYTGGVEGNGYVYSPPETPDQDDEDGEGEEGDDGNGDYVYDDIDDIEYNCNDNNRNSKDDDNIYTFDYDYDDDEEDDDDEEEEDEEDEAASLCSEGIIGNGDDTTHNDSAFSVVSHVGGVQTCENAGVEHSRPTGVSGRMRKIGGVRMKKILGILSGKRQ